MHIPWQSIKIGRCACYNDDALKYTHYVFVCVCVWREDGLGWHRTGLDGEAAVKLG